MKLQSKVTRQNNPGACSGAGTSGLIEYRRFNGVYDQMQPSKDSIVIVVSLSALIKHKKK